MGERFLQLSRCDALFAQQEFTETNGHDPSGCYHPARKAKPNPRSPRARPCVKCPSSQVPGLIAMLAPTDPTVVRAPLRFHRAPPRIAIRGEMRCSAPAASIRLGPAE